MINLRNQSTTFAQGEDEALYTAWEYFKDLLWLCPHHGLQKWIIVQTFYNRVTQLVRSTIDAMMGGTLMNKTEDEAYKYNKEMTLNDHQWSSEKGQSKLVRGKLEFDALNLLFAIVDVIT